MISDVLYQRPKTYQLFFAIEPKVSPLGRTPTILTVCVDGVPYTSRFTLFRTRYGGGGLWLDVRIMYRKMETINSASPERQIYGLLSDTCNKKWPHISFLVGFFLGIFTFERRPTDPALIIDLPKTKLV